MSNYKLCKLDGSHDFDFACSLSKKKCCSRKALFAKNNENATRESQECDAGITVLVTASFLKIFFAGNTFSDSDQLIEQNERNYRADIYSPTSIRTTDTVSTVDADDHNDGNYREASRVAYDYSLPRSAIRFSLEKELEVYR